MQSVAAKPRPMLSPGDGAPWFSAPVIGGKADWAFNTVGGRVCLMLFVGAASDPAGSAAIDAVMRRRAMFDDVGASFFGVTIDPADARGDRLVQQVPGIRFFLDERQDVSRQFGAIEDGDAAGIRYRPHFLLLDRQLRVIQRFAPAQAEQALDAVAEAARHPGQDWAPVLTVPRVLEPELCATLIAAYQRHGGEPSGFMRDIDGKTTAMLDADFKRRRDYDIAEPELRKALMHRLHARLVPAIQRTFQFDATRIERYIVACYDAGDRGAFRPHRDNTTKGTAHRRFAVTINLNGDYSGGDLRFPEFGQRSYRAPVGGAVVFSCSLLHEATPVTAGRRYAYLPFLYDEAAARIREANNPFLAESVGSYRNGPRGE